MKHRYMSIILFSCLCLFNGAFTMITPVWKEINDREVKQRIDYEIDFKPFSKRNIISTTLTSLLLVTNYYFFKKAPLFATLNSIIPASAKILFDGFGTDEYCKIEPIPDENARCGDVICEDINFIKTKVFNGAQITGIVSCLIAPIAYYYLVNR